MTSPGTKSSYPRPPQSLNPSLDPDSRVRKFHLEPKRIHEKEGDWPYKQAVSGMLWISGMTRPDIASAVSEVARDAHNAVLEGGSEENCLLQGN